MVSRAIVQILPVSHLFHVYNIYFQRAVQQGYKPVTSSHHEQRAEKGSVDQRPDLLRHHRGFQGHVGQVERAIQGKDEREGGHGGGEWVNDLLD